jgi:hypothetical protein
MNNPLLVVEPAHWNKIGRRWSIILAVLLTVNLSMVLVAVSAYAVGLSPLQAQIEQPVPPAAKDVDPAIDAPAVAKTDTPAPNEPVSASAEPSEPADPAAPITTTPQYAVGDEPTTPQPVFIAEGTPAEPLEIGTPPQEALVIANPARNGGAVHFLVDDIAVSLEAGELRRIECQPRRRIVFHPGNQLTNVELTLEPGVFAFSVTTAGWRLESAGAEAKVLLKWCRPVAAK